MLTVTRTFNAVWPVDAKWRVSTKSKTATNTRYNRVRDKQRVHLPGKYINFVKFSSLLDGAYRLARVLQLSHRRVSSLHVRHFLNSSNVSTAIKGNLPELLSVKCKSANLIEIGLFMIRRLSLLFHYASSRFWMAIELNDSIWIRVMLVLLVTTYKIVPILKGHFSKKFFKSSVSKINHFKWWSVGSGY